MVNRAFQFMVKQPAAAYGIDTLDQLTEKFERSGYNIRELIVDIAALAATQPIASQRRQRLRSPNEGRRSEQRKLPNSNKIQL